LLCVCFSLCLSSFVFFRCSAALRDLHSFPTRRSSDLRNTILGGFTTQTRDFSFPRGAVRAPDVVACLRRGGRGIFRIAALPRPRSEEHTSELQSRFDLVCRLLLEKKKKTATCHTNRGT